MLSRFIFFKGIDLISRYSANNLKRLKFALKWLIEDLCLGNSALSRLANRGDKCLNLRKIAFTNHLYPTIGEILNRSGHVVASRNLLGIEPESNALHGSRKVDFIAFHFTRAVADRFL